MPKTYSRLRSRKGQFLPVRSELALWQCTSPPVTGGQFLVRALDVEGKDGLSLEGLQRQVGSVDRPMPMVPVHTHFG